MANEHTCPAGRALCLERLYGMAPRDGESPLVIHCRKHRVSNQRHHADADGSPCDGVRCWEGEHERRSASAAKSQTSNHGMLVYRQAGKNKRWCKERRHDDRRHVSDDYHKPERRADWHQIPRPNNRSSKPRRAVDLQRVDDFMAWVGLEERRKGERRGLESPDFDDPRAHCFGCGAHATKPHLELCDHYGEKNGSEDWTDRRKVTDRRRKMLNDEQEIDLRIRLATAEARCAKLVRIQDICNGTVDETLDGKPTTGTIFDGTDAACPGWWRGHDHGAEGMRKEMENAHATEMALLQKAVKAMQAWFYCERHGIGAFNAKQELCNLADFYSLLALKVMQGEKATGEYKGIASLVIWPGQPRVDRAAEKAAWALAEKALALQAQHEEPTP
jgi:hypothetical protein